MYNLYSYEEEEQNKVAWINCCEALLLVVMIVHVDLMMIKSMSWLGAKCCQDTVISFQPVVQGYFQAFVLNVFAAQQAFCRPQKCKATKLTWDSHYDEFESRCQEWHAGSVNTSFKN